MKLAAELVEKRESRKTEKKLKKHCWQADSRAEEVLDLTAKL